MIARASDAGEGPSATQTAIEPNPQARAAPAMVPATPNPMETRAKDETSRTIAEAKFATVRGMNLCAP